MNPIYYNKYLKYKIKYTQLKDLLGKGGPSSKVTLTLVPKINLKKQRKENIEKRFKDVIQSSIDRYKELLQTQEKFNIDILGKTYAFPIKDGVVTYLLAIIGVEADIVTIKEIYACEDLFLYYLKTHDERKISTCPDAKSCSCIKRPRRLLPTHHTWIAPIDQPCILCTEGKCPLKSPIVNCRNSYLLLPESLVPVILKEENIKPDYKIELVTPENYVESDEYKQAVIKPVISQDTAEITLKSIMPLNIQLVDSSNYKDKKHPSAKSRQKDFQKIKEKKEISEKLLCTQWLSSHTCSHEKCNFVCKGREQTYCKKIIEKVDYILENGLLPIYEITIKMLEQLQNMYGKIIVYIIWNTPDTDKKLFIPFSYKTDAMIKAYGALMDNTININEHMMGIFNLWCIISFKSQKQKQYIKPISIEDKKPMKLNLSLLIDRELTGNKSTDEIYTNEKIFVPDDYTLVEREHYITFIFSLEKPEGKTNPEVAKLVPSFSSNDFPELGEEVTQRKPDISKSYTKKKINKVNFELNSEFNSVFNSVSKFNKEHPNELNSIIYEFNRRLKKCPLFERYYLRDKYMLIEGNYNENCRNKASIPLTSICQGGNCCLRGLHEGDILSLAKYTNNYIYQPEMIAYEQLKYTQIKDNIEKLENEYKTLMTEHYMPIYCDIKIKNDIIFQQSLQQYGIEKNKISEKINNLYLLLLKLQYVNIIYICDNIYNKYKPLPKEDIQEIIPVFQPIIQKYTGSDKGGPVVTKFKNPVSKKHNLKELTPAELRRDAKIKEEEDKKKKKAKKADLSEIDIYEEQIYEDTSLPKEEQIILFEGKYIDNRGYIYEKIKGKGKTKDSFIIQVPKVNYDEIPQNIKELMGKNFNIYKEEIKN